MVITACSIALGSRDARRELYLGYAEECARFGDWALARDAALAVVAHVDAEDPRAHWLIGQAAISERNDGEFKEAQRLLQLLEWPTWCSRLGDAWNQPTATLDYPPRFGRA